jgi:hypothetical protein
MPQQDVTISPAMYLIIQGQLGSVKIALDRLREAMTAAEVVSLAPHLMAAVEEVCFLETYLPRDPDNLQRPEDKQAKDTKYD